MSELREKLLGPRNIRSRIIKVVVLSIVLVTAFAFSVALINLVFGSLRFTPSYPMTDADFKYRDPADIPSPFSLSELFDFFQDLGLELTDDMIDTLIDMFDGDFDDIPLSELAALMAAMMFSDIEVFRVYDYTSPLSDMEDYLWKYESFDEYTSSTGSWSPSITSLDPYNFYSYSDYMSTFSPDPEILMLKMLNLSVNAGDNQFTAPTLFPTPYIIENSVNATGLDQASLLLRKQQANLNGMAIRGSFSSAVKTNLTYQLVGENLPTNAQIDSDCVYVSSPSADYDNIVDPYLELDGSPIANILADTDYADINYHYNYLKNNVINEGIDDAFTIADKVRNYLQYNFNLSYNPKPDAESDQINWFCKSQEGMYSDFASAFCALTRAFGVASRFVDGFNSRFISEEYDPIENDDYFAIKYQNMYSWAEIYIPTMFDGGSGYWAQIDVYYENFLGNPPLPIFDNNTYTIDIEINGSSFPSYINASRGEWVNITATLLNNSIPMANESITFIDYTEDNQVLGSNITNSLGETSILVQVNTSNVVGPHVIVGQYTPQIANFSYFILDGPIAVNLTGVSPGAINLSDTDNHTIQVQGLVYDPLNFEPVQFTNVNFILLRNGTTNIVSNAFTPSAITSDTNGLFNGFLDARLNIAPGEYNVRADVNGTWNYTITWFGFDYNISLPSFGQSGVSNSSLELPLHIDRILDKNLTLFINGIHPNIISYPQLKRGASLMLTALLLNESGGPIGGQEVFFYNYSEGNTLIGSNFTLPNGIATYNTNVSLNSASGPILLYAQNDNLINYSFFVIDENVSISIISGPSPLIINKTDSERFSIVGYLNDTVTLKPLINCSVNIRIFNQFGIEYTSNLTGTNPEITDSNGKFIFDLGVLDDIPTGDIPPGNYTIRLEFNGSFDRTSLPYPYFFNLNLINTNIILSDQLQVTYEAPLFFDFWIDGTASNQFELPLIYRDGAVNLTAQIRLGDTPMSGYNVSFYDSTQGNLFIGSNVTDINGYTTVIYNTDASTIAGPHLLYAKYGNAENYSYFILNAPVNITLDLGPINREVNCTTSLDKIFYIHGYLMDATNGAPIPYGRITILLINNSIDYSNQLLAKGDYQINNYFYCNTTGEIYAIFESRPDTIAQNYTLRLDFNGSINYADANYPVFFNLPFLNYTTNCSYELKVNDPLNKSISLMVDGINVPGDGNYPDSGLPSIVSVGENITFEGYIAGSAPLGGIIYLYDMYDDPLTPIASNSSSGITGYYRIELNTSTLQPGLHLMKVVFENFDNDIFNTTYIIINATFNLTMNSPATDFKIIRNTIGFNVSGRCSSDAGAWALRGMEVTILLLNGSGVNFTQYLDVIGGSFSTFTDQYGDYSFTINRISINCPYGNYTIRVLFNGSIYYSDAPDYLMQLNMNDAMINLNSSIINLNITANTYFNSSASNFNTNFQPTSPTVWIDGDTLHVFGQLLWDNGTGISNVFITLTVIYISNSSEIASNMTVSTSFNGNFDAIIQIDERFNGIIDISDSIISISFDPKSNGLDYVESPVDEVYN